MPKNNCSRRSQIEIVGLLIIVLMISFIILFAFIRSIRPESSLTDPIKKESLASDMISAMLYTTTDCTPYSIDMSDLLMQCVLWRDSGSGVAACKNGQSYCEYFNQTAKKMFDETFTVWSTSYEMIIIPPSGDFDSPSSWLFNFSGGIMNETESTIVASGQQPLAVSGWGNLNILLCIGGKCG
jgi:hypothetical protein